MAAAQVARSSSSEALVKYSSHTVPPMEANCGGKEMDLTAREKEEEKKGKRSGKCEGLLKSLNCIFGVC